MRSRDLCAALRSKAAAPTPRCAAPPSGGIADGWRRGTGERTQSKFPWWLLDERWLWRDSILCRQHTQSAEHLAKYDPQTEVGRISPVLAQARPAYRQAAQSWYLPVAGQGQAA